jgi:hypothetical protein
MNECHSLKRVNELVIFHQQLSEIALMYRRWTTENGTWDEPSERVSNKSIIRIENSRK